MIINNKYFSYLSIIFILLMSFVHISDALNLPSPDEIKIMDPKLEIVWNTDIAGGRFDATIYGLLKISQGNPIKVNIMVFDPNGKILDNETRKLDLDQINTGWYLRDYAPSKNWITGAYTILVTFFDSSNKQIKTLSGNFYFDADNYENSKIINSSKILISPISNGFLVDFTFYWRPIQNAKEYLIRIDNDTYESSTSNFSLSSGLSTGQHNWSIKPVFMNGSSGEWSENEPFRVAGPKIIEKPVDSALNNIIMLFGGILFSGVLLYFIRPYYKRARLKREMTKTPTDWCPDCHKFVGDSKVCPHCGKSTLREKKYEKAKNTKK